MTCEEQKNADRFTGFADVYDSARPSVPLYPVQIAVNYLGKTPDRVVDLGCGTGLSTLIWKEHAKEVVGIEPSDDMRAVAEQKKAENVRFEKGFGNKIPLENESADAVICSQSFHWMEPKSTLAEVNRILKPNGVFLTVDCDWPPVIDWRAEKLYMDLYEKIKELEKEFDDVNDTFVRYSKDKHLENIKASGYFRYAREIVFTNEEPCTAKRLCDLLLSQGSTQILLKLHPEMIKKDIDDFCAKVHELLGDKTYSAGFCYRMRIGVK